MKKELNPMAYETQVILKLLADSIGRVKTAREAYNIVARAARNEGVNVLSYEEFTKILDEEKEHQEK
jgi:rubrerythrin